ncbi:SOS response-associated peptidase [Halobacillus sp. A1]|uniref:SOS response-associated peptidase n=1 Tax=Halobacillus sp. A1 TaxID=2880262 RepID=UPI0020A67BD4|nr:SOS response-associated peptidase [Halobacillus sp. A1]MCP3030174.1 SOS response-associated peptidase [Halobacillus sp. A1]
MCGRFTLTVDERDIRNEFELNSPIPEFEQRYNIAPGQKVLAVINDGEKNRAGYMYWGLVPSWAKDPKIGYKMINARSETAHKKPSFKNLMAKKRCLIIADSFYEWKRKDKIKQPYRIKPTDRKLFTFAGLWDQWKTQEEERFTCTILTREANAFMESIHDRMPVILPKNSQSEWIAPSTLKPEDAHDFINKLTMEELEANEVSTYVNSAKNEGPECIRTLS